MNLTSSLSLKNYKNLFVFGGLFLFISGVIFYSTFATKVTASIVPNIQFNPKPKLSKEDIVKTLATDFTNYRFPGEIELPNQLGKGIVEYTMDPKLQESMIQLFKSYNPDYGAFVAMDAETGRVLSLVSYSAKPSVKENLALRATFPSASVFKVVTAAAAIENRKLSSDSVIPFHGANHTLYRGNLFNTRETRWTRYTTLKTAFAKSINTVFGKIGVFTVGPESLRTYADRFGFNRTIPTDLPVQPGKAPISDDPWNLAEAASGYTRENTMSPLQGALIAAAVVNNGVMMEPYLIESVFTPDGNELYDAKPTVATVSIDPKTAEEVHKLMNETVNAGTSKKSFRGFFKGGLASLDVGGKTGTLTGASPPGKYDWFVGFAEGYSKKIAFSALLIHEKFWKVKASYISRKALENYFK